MAYGDTFTPTGASNEIKIRGPVWVGVWSLVTLGVYAVYWIYVTAKHLRDAGNARGRDLGQRPGMTLLALTLGWLLLLIPPIVAMYRQAKRIQQVQQLAGVAPMNGWLALVLYLVISPVFFAYEQVELNKAWAAEGGPVPVADNEAPSLPAATPEEPVMSGAQSAPATQELRSPERPGE